MTQVVQVPAPPPVPPIPEVVVLPPWMTVPPPVITLISIAFIAGVSLVLFPIARALARRIEGRGAASDLEPQVGELRDRMREVEGVQHRVAELEERLEFTERLLAQRREAEPLPRHPAP
jgi:hypothetical protein